MTPLSMRGMKGHPIVKTAKGLSLDMPPMLVALAALET